jgi:hypothetical protein
MTQSKNSAIDLMLEDLHIKHHEIRVQATLLNCEKELEEIKINLIEYLTSMKK